MKRKPVHGESVNKSLLADSSYEKTGVDDMPETKARAHRRALYKSVSHFRAHDLYLIRRHENMTFMERTDHSGMILRKRERRARRARKRDEGKSAGSDEEISSFSE